MKVRGALFRPLLITLAIAMSLASAGLAQTMSVDPGPDATAVPSARKILPNIPTDLVPAYETLWKCACDSDGCWPGCFTLASASVLKYWSQKAYPNLWPYRGVEDENNGLIRLRELFPNLLCFGNGNGNGQPGDSGYDAFDVATGLRQWTVEHGYRFVITPVPSPSFEQIMAEIDAGRPVIGAFGQSPWGSHAGTIIGYDTSKKRQVMIVRPNLPDKADTELEWGIGYQEFGIVTVAPGGAGGEELAPAQMVFDVVVGANDPGFSAAGDWRDAGGLGHAGAARFAPIIDGGPTADESAFARWTPQIPFDGAWEVMAWMPLDKADPTTSGSVLYKIAHAEGQSLVRRSQRDAPQGWLSLGTFPLVRGQRGSVAIGNTSAEAGTRQVWADAVRFVWRAPLLLRGEDDPANTYLVRDGRRRALPQDGGLTFAALRLLPSDIRKLTPLQIAQYPSGEPIPSVLSAWVGSYFNNTQLAPPSAAIRNDTPLALRWEGLSPVAGVSAIGFSGRWTRVMAFSQGAYTIKLQAAGGLRLWVDGRLEIDAWDAQGAFIEHKAKVALDGGLHRLEVEYVNRTGGAALVFVDLPPNPPLPVDQPVLRYTRGLTATLSWLDTGDADGGATNAPRRFTVSVGRENPAAGAPLEILNSDWLTTTSWVAQFPGSGAYVWRVAAGDGATVSEWSAPRRIVVDRAPPWAQMASATNPSEELDPAQKGPQAPSRAPGLRLRWTQTDTLSGVAFVDIQAREIVRASTGYTFATEYRETTRSAVEVVVEGGREITRSTLITALVPFTGVVEVRTFAPNPTATWKLVQSNLTGSETFFVGTPGAVYEFRARAVDWAGNAQEWYDGYSVAAQMDPNAIPAPPTFTPVPTGTPTRVPPTAIPPTQTPVPTATPSRTPTPTPTTGPKETAVTVKTPASSPTTPATPTATPTPTPQATPTFVATSILNPAATQKKTEPRYVASTRLDLEPTPTGVLSPLASPTRAISLKDAYVNSAYLRVDVLSTKITEAPLPEDGSCLTTEDAQPGARAILNLRVSNYSPIDIRGWRLSVLAGDEPARVCLLGAEANERLPAIPPGTRRDFTVLAYAPIDAPFTNVEAQWQGERFTVCVDNGLVAKGCAPQSVPIPTIAAGAPTPVADFSNDFDRETADSPDLSPTSTPTPTAVPVPTPMPTRSPLTWTVTAQSLDASAWGRPIKGSCFAYDDGDPVTRWQAGLRIENLSSTEMRDLRVTFFEGANALRTCFHGYGGLMPNIPAADGRNISFFAFVEKRQAVTSVLIEAMGQSRRMCVVNGMLNACK